MLGCRFQEPEHVRAQTSPGAPGFLSPGTTAGTETSQPAADRSHLLSGLQASPPVVLRDAC